ncbi:Pimeloyl-ACP methyl ester carboxylesterase [Chitinophaga eiseniae]|uniref:Pimeloyl-ACP methyl ester carboxylesterase n=1 Tax=Chitinophaga eiseniae TaxID=634771 RepID=A0A1T4TVS3_9BACT|nr:alpha/beta hydrolase [Chitinophaga eiseniae]SKA44329.1 Pimeloyl-ACP methyl ester carboxylesterase [Chitinophaga eiseniae]
MAPWHNGTCTVNNILLHYTRTGGDKPPVILLHGLMTNGLCWSALARELEKDYDIIMPDLRGHGQSAAPDHGYRYDDHANDVAGLITALALPAPVLIGHSMGGMTAAVVASRTPNLLRGLVLADPTFLSPEIQREVHNSDVAEQHRKALNMSLDELMDAARTRHPHRSAETIELFARARLQTNMAAFEVLTPPNPDYQQLIRETTVPSLLIFGDKGVVTWEVAAALQQLNSGLQAEQIPLAGHSVHIDQPERFTAMVKTFLHAITS